MKIEKRPNVAFHKLKKSRRKSTSLPSVITPEVTSLEVEVKDGLNHRYAVGRANAIWSLDVTSRGIRRPFYVLAVQDMASRRILRFLTKEGQITSADVKELLLECFKDFGVPSHVHNDMGSVFTSEDLVNFLTEYNVVQNIVTQEFVKHDNQAHERFHRHLWETVGVYRDEPLTIEDWDETPSNARQQLVEYSIELYNSGSSWSVKSESREDLDKALRSAQYVLALQIAAVGRSDSRTALLVKDFHLAAIKHFKGDTIKAIATNFFGGPMRRLLDIVPQLADIRSHVSSEIREASSNILDQIAESNAILLKELDSLKQSNEEKDIKINRLLEEIKLLQEHSSYLVDREKAKEQRRLKRKERKSRMLRDAFKLEDFPVLLTCCKDRDKYIEARNRTAFALLLMTGLRVQNLKLIRVSHLLDLLNGKDISVHLVKLRGSKEIVTFPYQAGYRKIISYVKKEMELLTEDSDKLSSPFALSREHLTRTLNNILRKASAILGKNLKTHSFRIFLATETTDKYGLQVAKTMLNHRNVSTTERYNRGQITKRKKQKVLTDILLTEGEKG